MNEMYGCNWGYFAPKSNAYKVPKNFTENDVTYEFSVVPDLPRAQACILHAYHTKENVGYYALISYSTCVACFDDSGYISCRGTYSATTRKHIGAFAKFITKMTGKGVSYFTFKSACLGSYEYNIFTGEIKEYPHSYDETAFYKGVEDMYRERGGVYYGF